MAWEKRRERRYYYRARREHGRTVIATLERRTNASFKWRAAYCVTYRPDGGALVSAIYGSLPLEIKVWNATTGKSIVMLRENTDVTSVAFNPDGKTLASGDLEGTIKLWNLATGRITGTLKQHQNYVTSLAYSPDGKPLASGSWDTTIKLWDVATGRNTATLRGHTDWVMAVAFRPDGNTLASASEDKTTKLWDGCNLWIALSCAV
jgi:WD40 repeat protein